MRTQAHRDDHVRAWGGDSSLHAKERGLSGNQPCDTLPPEPRDCKCLLLQPPHLSVTQAPGPAHRKATESNPPHSTAYGHVTPGPISTKPASHTRHARLLHVGTGAPKIRVCSRLTVFRRKHTENKRGCIHSTETGERAIACASGKRPSRGMSQQGLCEDQSASDYQTFLLVSKPGGALFWNSEGEKNSQDVLAFK